MSATSARSSNEVAEDQQKRATVREIEKGSSPTRKRSRRVWWIVIPIVVIIALALGLGLGLGLTRRNQNNNSSSSPTTSPSSTSQSTNLTVGETWDLPLGGDYTLNAQTDPFPTDSAAFLSVDLFNTATEGIQKLVNDAHFVACYFSAGSVESYRPDAGDFPASAVGKDMIGWQGEKWVDIRDSGVRSVMTKRLALAQSKGCAGVDADNINIYENDSGFNLTQDDATNFVQFLAQGAHGLGMQYGLKNGGDIVPQVLNVSDWVINEQCVQTSECDLYAPFIQANKPVFHVEYTDDENATSVDPDTKANYCGAEGQQGFSTIIKHLNLDAWTVHC